MGAMDTRMPRTLLAAASAALIASGGAAAPGQAAPPGTPGGGPQGAGAFDCARLAGMPNAPMSVEACRQMMGPAADIQGAMDDPAARRPGDEAMTCDQIKAEYMAQGPTPVDRGHLAAAQSAARNFQAKSAQVQAEGTALAAEQTATNMAAGAAGLVPGVGQAAAMAAQAKNDAEQKAFNEHARQIMAPAEQGMMSSTGTLMGDMAGAMQRNPRQARLMSLAMQKNCR